MSFNTIKNEYNQLEMDSKSMFLEFHAPKNLKQNEALVRRYIPFYMEHNKSFRLPKGTELLQESAEGAKVRLSYITMPIKHVNELEAITRYQDNRGVYTDELGKVQPDIIFQSGKYFKVVKDLSKEIEFLNGLVSKPAISPSALMGKTPVTAKEIEAAIVEDSKEAIEGEEIYKEYIDNKQKYSKKEFLAYMKEKGIELTKYRLDKIIKQHEAV